jgi:hypothetical protein
LPTNILVNLNVIAEHLDCIGKRVSHVQHIARRKHEAFIAEVYDHAVGAVLDSASACASDMLINPFAHTLALS